MQNFRTSFRSLSAPFAEAMAASPAYTPPTRGHGFFGESTYHVIDVTFADGTVLVGLLAWDGRVLLPEEDAARLGAVAITGIVATAPEAIPDFTITDKTSVWDDPSGTIEHGNLQRLTMFGPPDEADPDWRTVPVEDAHEEALSDNRGVTVYPELGACRWLSDVRLTPAGFAVTAFRMRVDAAESVVVRPVSRALWSDLLQYHTVRLDPGVTLRTLLEMLLESPLDVQGALAARVIDLETLSFARYGAALVAAPDPDDDRSFSWQPDACLTVSRAFDWDSVEEGEAAALSPYLHTSALALPGPGEAEMSGRPDGRISWSLTGCPLRTLADLPLAVDVAFEIPHLRAEWDAWYRASVREPGDDRPVTPRPGPRYTGAMTFTWDDLLRALFDELPRY